VVYGIVLTTLLKLFFCFCSLLIHQSTVANLLLAMQELERVKKKFPALFRSAMFMGGY